MPTGTSVRSTSWRSAVSVWVRDAGHWKVPKAIYVRVGDQWKQVSSYNVIPKGPQSIASATPTTVHDSLTITWTNPSTPVPVSYIRVDRCDVYGNILSTTQLPANTTTYSVALAPDTIALFRLRAYGAGGVPSSDAFFGWYTGKPATTVNDVPIYGWGGAYPYRVQNWQASWVSEQGFSYPYAVDGDDNTGWSSPAIPINQPSRFHQGMNLSVPATLLDPSSRRKITRVSIQHNNYPEDISISFTDGNGNYIPGALGAQPYADVSFAADRFNTSKWGYANPGAISAGWTDIDMQGYGGSEAVISAFVGDVHGLVLDVGPSMTAVNALAIAAVINAIVLTLQDWIVVGYGPRTATPEVPATGALQAYYFDRINPDL